MHCVRGTNPASGRATGSRAAGPQTDGLAAEPAHIEGPPCRAGSRCQWTRPALPRRPKAFPQRFLRAQSAVSISRGASPSTNRSPARRSYVLTRRPSAVAAGPGSLADTGDPPHDPKGGRWLSVLLVRQRERAWESSPQLRWFPVVDAVLRVRGSLTDVAPLRRNWIGPVVIRVAPPGDTITRCARS